MNKKIMYVGILLIVILAIVAFFLFLNVMNKNNSTSTDKMANSDSVTVVTPGKQETSKSSVRSSLSNTPTPIVTTPKPKLTTTVTELADGKLYSVAGGEVKADVVIGDNYYDTQINNMMTNPSDYAGKNIEIEGMYLLGELDPNTLLPYTFVGRYSTSNICSFCPAGYSYMEYEWYGDKIELADAVSWIKVVGTLNKGNDGYVDYYYIDAKSIEVMNERGEDTVNN